MPEIVHHFRVAAPPSAVYLALTDESGLRGWWTTRVSAAPVVGSIAEFAFGDATPIRLQVAQLEANRRVVWRGIDGLAEWSDTTIAFELSPTGDATAVRFLHSGWRSAEGILGQCSFDWASYLVSLRALVETGVGVPHGSPTMTSNGRAANADVVRQLYARLMGRGDLGAADECLAECYIDHDVQGLDRAGTREDLKSAVLAVRASFPDITPTLLDVIVDADRVAVRVEAAGTHTGTPFMGVGQTGRPMRWNEQHVFRCADGRIVEHWGVFDLFGILRQLGAVP